MTHRDEVIGYALRYAALGWRVCPCIGKNPGAALGTGWQDKASADPETIKRWFDKLPYDVNLGLLTGWKFFVLDVDKKSGGLESLDEIEAKYGKLPDTLQAVTGSGGRHYYFLLPADLVVHSIPQSKMWPGVEIKAHHSFVVCSPSIHPDTGQRYDWDGMREIEDTPILPAPEWLLQIVRQGGLQAKPKGGAEPINSVIPYSTQHLTLVSLAGTMRDRGMNAEEIFAALCAVNANRCERPGPEENLRKIAESFMNYKPGKARRGELELKRQYESERVREVALEASKATVIVADPAYRQPGGKLELSPTTGKPERSLFNATQALTYAPHWCSKLAYNEFTMKVIAGEPLCEGRIPAGRVIGDVEVAQIRIYMQGFDGVHVGKDETIDAIRVVAGLNSSHPVRNYLSGLAWDGTYRVSSWLTRYLGVEDSLYARAVGQKWLISAVARIKKPGEKADVCLILEGPQGRLKSTALRVLANAEWFSDGLGDIGNKDTLLGMRGKWIIEIAEIDKIFIREASEVKDFVSRRSDLYRPPYAREVIEVPRESIFAGTTNKDDYLRDETGARRFWPVVVGDIDIPALEADRDQLWAEACSLYQGGEPWHITAEEREIAEQALAEQRARYEGDPWEEAVLEYCHSRAGKPVFIEDVLLKQINKKLADVTKQDRNRVAKILKSAGYKRSNAVRIGKKTRSGFYPPDALPGAA